MRHCEYVDHVTISTTYMLIHYLASIVIIKKVPISEDRVANTMFCRLIDFVDGEFPFRRRGPIADVKKNELAKAFGEVIGEARQKY